MSSQPGDLRKPSGTPSIPGAVDGGTGGAAPRARKPLPIQVPVSDADPIARDLRNRAIALRRQADVLEDRAEIAEGVGRTQAAEEARREADGLIAEARKLDAEADQRSSRALEVPSIDPRLREVNALLEVSRSGPNAKASVDGPTPREGSVAAPAPSGAGSHDPITQPQALEVRVPAPVVAPLVAPALAPIVPKPTAAPAPAATGAPAAQPANNTAAAANAMRGAAGDLVLPGDWSHYEVLGVLGEGGMGRVFRVRHRAWDQDMVVKVPRGSMLQRQGFLAALVGEAEAWAGLGLHPNTVTCYYARVHRGVPWLFAEFVDGGSLTDWIRTKRLYEPPHALARVLDVAIQTARGLDHAHERGLIHQDIKPANVLMTSEGVAKVTDFGLSRAAHLGLSATGGGASETLISEYGGMTPAYASPEQMQAARDGRVPLTRRTDAWSWALTVLEMFTGRLTWNDGRQAVNLLNAYLAAPPDLSRPMMPPGVANLLRRCFATNEYDRPTSLREIADELCEIYPEVTGRPAPHTLRAGSDPADVLFNRGASYDDLGDRDRALALWSEALELEPHHAHATYARALWRWRRAEITDADAVREMLEAGQSHPDSWQVSWLLAWLHAERGDDASARAAIEVARAVAKEDPAAMRAISRAEAAVRPGIFRRADLPAPPNYGPAALSGDARVAVLSGVGREGVPVLYPCDAGQGRVIATVVVPHLVERLSLSDDGRVAAISGAYRVTVLDLTTGATGFAVGSGVTRTPWVALSADGSRIALLIEGRAEIYALPEGRKVWVGPTSQISGWSLMAVDATIGRVAVADARGVVFAFQTNTGAELGRWELGVSLSSLKFLRDGSLVVAWWDPLQAVGRTARLAAPVNNDRGISVPTQTTAACTQLALGPGPWTTYEVGADGVLRRWDLSQRRCITTAAYVGHFAPVRGVSTSRDGSAMLVVHSDGTSSVCAAAEALPWAPVPVVRPGRAEDVLARRAAFDASLQYARSMASRGDWPAATDSLARSRAIPGFARSPEARSLWWRLSEHARRGRIGRGWAEAEVADLKGPVRGVEIDPRGEVVCATAGDHEVRVWDAASGAPLRVLTHTGPVRALCMAPRGGWVLTAEPGWLRLFRYDTGACVHAVRMAGAPSAVSLAADARHACAVTTEGVGVWDLATGALKSAAPVPSARQAALSEDGNWLLVVPASGPAALWDVQRSQWVRQFNAPSDAWAAAITSNGRRVLVACHDGKLRVWDVPEGRMRAELAHDAPCTGVAVSFDGLLAVTTDARGAVRVWDLASMTSSAWLSGHASFATDVALTPCGRRAVTGGRDGFVRVWRLEWELVASPGASVDDAAWPWVHRFLVRGGSNALASVPPGVAPSELLRELSWAGFGHLTSQGVRAMVDALLRGDPAAKSASREPEIAVLVGPAATPDEVTGQVPMLPDQPAPPSETTTPGGDPSAR